MGGIIIEGTATDDIVKELQALRTELQASSIARDSEWSAHAKWKSSSKFLDGEFALTSHLAKPQDRDQLNNLITESSSEAFVNVARSLSSLMAEKK